MWERFLTTLPEIAGHPLAILAYMLVVISWLIWLIKRTQTTTFLSALDKLPEDQRKNFSKQAGYQYDDLSNLTKAQRYSLLTKRFLLIGFISTLIAILIFIALFADRNQEITRLQERVDGIDKQRITLQETLDEHMRSRAQFAVNATSIAGRLSVVNDTDVKREANMLAKLIIDLLIDVPRENLSSEQATVIKLSEATILNAKGDYDATLELITGKIIDDAVSLAARSLQIRGDALYGKQDWSSALEHYDRVRAIQPQNYFVRFLIGNCDLHLAQYQSAISAFTDVIEAPVQSVSPRWKNASFNNRGNIHVLLNNYKKAVQDFSKAIDVLKAHPKLSDLKLELAMVLANRAHTLNRLKETEKADRDFVEVQAIVAELNSKHVPGSSPDDLLSWLKKKAEPLGPPTGSHDHGSKKSCFMCHAVDP